MTILLSSVFVMLLTVAFVFFWKNTQRLWQNIKVGKPFPEIKASERKLRLKKMLYLALGQGKMGVRPIAGLLHLIVYIGFFIVNIEMLEIITDGILGTHRIFGFMGKFYNFLIGSFEIIALGVIVSVVVFWFRRNILKIARFQKEEIQNWAKADANYILYFEATLMLLFLLMNAADFALQKHGLYPQLGSFPISGWLTNILPEQANTLIMIERGAWWLHIVGVLFFMNYLYYSKHLHIFLAFPYIYLSPLSPKGKMENMPRITTEVKLMLDPLVNPYAQTAPQENTTFGAADVFDLNNIQLLAAYTCTQCGRCSDECPANLTGKRLSPRKIMMATRERLSSVGENIRQNGSFKNDNKPLLHHYITPEELWACTACNACVEACPLEISPVSIILEMRRFLVMEEASSPNAIRLMQNNIENNGAPWAYSTEQRNNIFL